MSPTTQDAGNEKAQPENVFLNQDGHVDFSPNDPQNPKNWSYGRKCYTTALAILLVMNATFASSAPSAVVEGISQDLHVSIEASGLVTTMFLIGFVAGPLLWGPLSEFYGYVSLYARKQSKSLTNIRSTRRRIIFLITFTCNIAFGFLCAFTPNFAGLVVGRFFAAVFTSAALTNAPGVLADIWDPAARRRTMILFVVMTFIGPALGPVIAGFTQLKLNWRWCFYIILWIAGFSAVLLVFTLPETLASIILQKRARDIRKRKLEGLEDVVAPIDATDRRLLSIYKTALTRPWIILFDPISFFVAIYYALVYTLLYMLFTIYPIVFQQKRGWNAGVGELPLIGVIIGACLAGLLILWLDRAGQKEEKTSTPEDGMPAAMIGAVIFPVSMFWFAWTGEYNSIHWIVPTLAGVFLTMAILLIFVALVNYVVDSYVMFAASALAANTVVRSASAAAAPLYAQYMFNSLGVGGAGSLIAGLAVLFLPIPFVFYKYGAVIRDRSKFARSVQNEAGK